MRNILLALGDLDKDLDLEGTERVGAFISSFADEIAKLVGKAAFIVGGRKDTIAHRVMKKLENDIGHQLLARRVTTYLPEDLSLTEVPPDDFVHYGKIIHTGRLIEDRREAMIRDCDAVVLMGTGRGIYDLAGLAKRFARYVVPVPIAGGPAIDAYSRIMRFSTKSEAPVPEFDILGDARASGVEISNAVGELLNQFIGGEIGKSQVFLAMPFISAFAEREKAEKALSRVCNRNNCKLYVAKDTAGHKPLISEILEQIERSAVVVAYLDGSRPNVYLELGYGWGKGKPVILCIKVGSDPAFDVSAHEQIRWTSIMHLERQLDARFKKLIDERLLVA